MGLTTTKRQGPAAPKIVYQTLKGWSRGRFSRLDRDRTPLEGLVVTENVRLDQDGTVAPRYGLKLYGVQPVGTVLGKPFEYVRMNGTTPETWLIWMENRAGVGTVVTAKNGAAAIVVSGKTYSSTAKAHFEQIYGKVIITNGSDTLSWMDVQTQTITVMTVLTQPTGVSATAAVINGSTSTLRYRVTACNQGETAASSAVTVGVSRLRETWNGTTEYVDFVFNRVTNATRYNIYVGDTTGSEFYLDTVSDNSAAGATQTYRDIGSLPTTPTRMAPVGDSTAGPKTTRSTNIKGQIYMVGDVDNPGRIWFGGAGSSALDFSSFNGGGWVEPNKGGKDVPVIVKPFRDGKGTSMAVCLSKGTNGAGKRYLLQPQTTTLGNYTISYMSVQEDNGADGTDSPDAVLLMNDSLFYPSRGGFKVSNTKANLQNLISTSGISDNIAPDVASLSSQYMDAADGLADSANQMLYFAVPYASTTNSQIWTVDLRQKGAWMTPWNIAADGMWFYADNTDGKTKHLILVGNKFYEFDPGTATNDDGVAFQTTVGSGEIKFGDNGEWASIIDVTFEFLRPQGNINLAVTVHTEDGTLPLTETMSSSTSQTISAWGRFGWGISGWGQAMASLIPVASPMTRKKWTIEVDEECDSISWGLNTTEAGVSYQLSKVIIRYVSIGWKDIDN
jgi:hypothetical protein